MTDTAFKRETLKPKPFVFVLMPFDRAFDDIYKFGIGGAATEVGAYAERIDEQIFTEGILDRIFNQISRADVIVADMTGRNANVFYEVGYAHALGKIVLLLTQDANDIPFDLKHRQHIVYGGSIDRLKTQLSERLRWAIRTVATEQSEQNIATVSVRLANHDLTSGLAGPQSVVVRLETARRHLSLPLSVKNESDIRVSEFTHIYLFTEDDARIVPGRVREPDSVRGFFSSRTSLRDVDPIPAYTVTTADAPDRLTQQYRLPNRVPALPPGAVEHDALELLVHRKVAEYSGYYRLRFHSETAAYDFSFRLEWLKPKPEPVVEPPVSSG